MEKTVHLKINRNDKEVSLQDITQMIEEIRRKFPDRDVFFDGDDYAICSRPKPE